MLSRALCVVVFAACGCRALQTGQTAGSTLLDTVAVNYEDELGMRPGVGLDVIVENVRGECVAHDGLGEVPAPGQEAEYQIRIIESHKDLLGDLTISAASQVASVSPDPNTPVSRKSRFGLGTSFGISRYQLYLGVKARVANATQTLKNPRLKTTPGADVKAFRDQCGDSYLVGSTSGGEFYAVIEVDMESDEAKAAAKARYGGAVPGGSRINQGLIDAGLRAAVQGRSMRAWTYQRGGTGENEVGMVTSVDDVMNRLKRLAESAKTSPRPLTATFTDYLTLGATFPPSYVEQLDAAREKMSKMADTLAQLLDLKANIDYVLQRPNSFVNVDGAKLAEMTRVRDKIFELGRKANAASRACTQNLAQCAVPADFTIPALELPRRRATIAQLQNEQVRAKADVTYLNASGLRDSWQNSPECYVVLKAGRKDNNANVIVHRAPTDYGSDRCRNAQGDFKVPVWRVKEAYRQLGIAPEQGWFEYGVFEEDPWYDDHISSAYVDFDNMVREGPIPRAITHDHLHVNVYFEVQY